MSCAVGIESFEGIVVGRMGNGWSRAGEEEGTKKHGAGEEPKGQLSLDKIWQKIDPCFQEKKMLVCPVFSCCLFLT